MFKLLKLVKKSIIYYLEIKIGHQKLEKKHFKIVANKNVLGNGKNSFPSYIFIFKLYQCINNFMFD